MRTLHKCLIMVSLAALLVLSACSSKVQNTDVAQELSTSELDSATADLDQLDTQLNEADNLEADLAELEELEIE